MKKAKPFFLLLGILCILMLIIFGGKIKDYLTEYTTGNSSTSETLVSETPKLDGTWSVDDQGWRFMDLEQNYASDETRVIDGKEYFFNSDGYMETGWAKKETNWYYLSYAGQKETGWLADENKDYYLASDGVMVTGWQSIDGENYYFQSDGSLSYGWTLLDDQYYYMKEDGTVHTGWLIDEEKYYYLDNDGVMQTGWLNDGGTYYYLDEDGATVDGWQTIDSKKYYFTEYGSLYTGWLTDSGSSYYFDSDGYMAIGWLQLDNERYFMDSEGAMRTGWIVDNNKAYYLNSNGVLEANKKAKAGSVIALTFDDGPGAYTDRLLTALEASDAKATFFVLGSLVDKYPDTLKRMRTNGCQIGNHTYDHENLTTLDEDAIKAQIKDTSKKVKAASGKGTKLIRPPYGAYNDDVKEYTNAPLIMWSIDTLDWQTKNAAATVELVLNNVTDGDIILMHDIHSTTVDAAEILIPTLTSMGYELATVSELAAAKGSKLEAKTAYSSFK